MSYKAVPISTGIALACHSPAPEHADVFSEWYEREVMAPIVKVKGVLGATRYIATEDWVRAEGGGMVPIEPPANFLCVYGLEHPDVARSAAFLDATGHTYTEQYPEVDGNPISVRRNFAMAASGIGRMDNPPNRDPDSGPRGLLLVSLSPEPDWEDRMREWYDEIHLPELLVCPGFIGAHRWRVLEGLPNLLAFYDLESVGTLKTDEFKAVSGRPVDKLPPLAQEVGKHRTSNICTTYEEVLHVGERLPGGGG